MVNYGNLNNTDENMAHHQSASMPDFTMISIIQESYEEIGILLSVNGNISCG